MQREYLGTSPAIQKCVPSAFRAQTRDTRGIGTHIFTLLTASNHSENSVPRQYGRYE